MTIHTNTISDSSDTDASLIMENARDYESSLLMINHSRLDTSALYTPEIRVDCFQDILPALGNSYRFIETSTGGILRRVYVYADVVNVGGDILVYDGATQIATLTFTAGNDVEVEQYFSHEMAGALRYVTDNPAALDMDQVTIVSESVKVA